MKDPSHFDTYPSEPPFVQQLRSPSPGFNFNVSHDGAWVAIASESLCLVGLDLMKSDKTRVREGGPLHHFFRSFRKCYTPLEWATVEGCGPDRDRILDQFFRLAQLVLGQGLPLTSSHGMGEGFGASRRRTSRRLEWGWG